MKRDLLSILDLTRPEIEHLLALAARLKAELNSGKKHAWLPGRTLTMIFEKPSLRTRVTFEAGMNQLGGIAIYLAPGDIRFGQRESVADIARNLSRWVDLIMARTYVHASIVELAEHATVPVINGLTDMYHPCQVLADCFTLRELHPRLEGLHVVFVGDGNNMVHSWLLACARMNMRFTLVCPPGYEPDPKVIAAARKVASTELSVTSDLAAGSAGADVLYTDVWTSMGQEAEAERRRRAFRAYRIDREVVENASPDVLVMHCLPAHRGEEITSEVLDGPRSVVLRQAENRLHVQKAVIAWLLDAKEARP